VIYIEENLNNIDYSELNALLAESLGREKAKDTSHTEKLFSNSQKYAFVYDDKKLVGAVRALSDGEWSVIYNFTVSKEYEGKIEKELINNIVDQLKGQHIFVNAESEKIGVFEEHGFQRTKTAFTYVGFDGIEEEYPKGYFLPLYYRFENEFENKKLPFPGHRKGNKMKKAEIVYSSARNTVDYKRVTEIIFSAFDKINDDGGEISVEKILKTRNVFDMSKYVFFAYDRNKLVGVARAITDEVEEAYIQNVAVDPEYQGYGIGWHLVTGIGDCIQKDGLNPFLHTHPGAVGFYNHKGFLRNKTTLDYRNEEERHESLTSESEQGFYMPKGFRFADELQLMCGNK